MKNKPKKINKKTEEISEIGGIRVLLEDMKDSIQIVAEGQTSLREEMHREIGGLREEMHKQNEKMRSEMKEGFAVIIDHLERIDVELVAIRKELKNLKETKSDKKENLMLKKRVAKMEKEMVTIKILLKKKNIRV